MKNYLHVFIYLFSVNAFAQFDETKIQAPFKISNEQSLEATVCRTRDHLRWDVCSILFNNKEEQERSFVFTNVGENKIVPKSGWGVGRRFEFMFEDFARSDLSLLLWDMPDEVESHGHLKMMMFFPREVMPAIRYESDETRDIIIVTLPTREEVIFNGKTYEVIGGVFSESPMKQDQNGNSLNPGITYTGSHVVVEANRLNDYPVGVAKNGKNNIATIKKAGYKNCKIPASQLWYTDTTKNDNVLFNKQYVTDAAFDALIKKKCGFSIY